MNKNPAKSPFANIPLLTCSATIALVCSSCAGSQPKQEEVQSSMLQSRGAGQMAGTGGTAPPEMPGGSTQQEITAGSPPQETEAPQEFARPERGSLLSQPTPQPQQAGNLMTTDSGLQFEDIVVGQGPNAQYGQTVTVHYTGWLTNGTKFDSSRDKGQPFQFVLGAGEVIKGWDEGVSTMRIGGRRRLIIPPQLGYADRGAGGVIPPGATLVFEVELLGAQ